MAGLSAEELAFAVFNGKIELEPEGQALFDKAFADGDYDTCRSIIQKYYAPFREYLEADGEYTRMKDAKKFYDYVEPGIDLFSKYANTDLDTRVNDEETDRTYKEINGLVGTFVYEPDADIQPGELAWVTDDQRNIYNHIYNTEGLEKANEFAEKTMFLCYANHSAHDQEYMQKLMEEGGVGAIIAANAVSFLTFVGEIPAAFSTIFRVAAGKYVEPVCGLLQRLHMVCTISRIFYCKSFNLFLLECLSVLLP